MDTTGTLTTVDAGGRTLAAYVIDGPADRPVVIFECGLGDGHHGWDAVVHELDGELSNVCYDRAAYGRSQPAPLPRTLAGLAGDLVAVCEQTAADRDLLLVGHSLGGRLIRAAAPHLPKLAGLVLIEGAPDDFPKHMPRVAKAQTATLATYALLSRTGVLRTKFARRKLAGILALAPEEAAYADIMRDVDSPEFWREVRSEWATMSDPMPPLDPKPPAIEMLSSGWDDWKAGSRARFGASGEQLLGHVRRSFERDFPEGQVVIVERTSHRINRDRPDAVADCIRSVAAGR